MDWGRLSTAGNTTCWHRWSRHAAVGFRSTFMSKCDTFGSAPCCSGCRCIHQAFWFVLHPWRCSDDSILGGGSSMQCCTRRRCFGEARACVKEDICVEERRSLRKSGRSPPPIICSAVDCLRLTLTRPLKSSATVRLKAGRDAALAGSASCCRDKLGISAFARFVKLSNKCDCIRACTSRFF